jgi:hypothetical protein
MTRRPPDIGVRTPSNEASPNDGGDADDGVALLRSGFRSDTSPPVGFRAEVSGSQPSTAAGSVVSRPG